MNPYIRLRLLKPGSLFFYRGTIFRKLSRGKNINAIIVYITENNILPPWPSPLPTGYCHIPTWAHVSPLTMQVAN